MSLFEIPMPVNIGLTCNTCEHRQRWEFGASVFQYCSIRKSNRTSNGLLKIKCKDAACEVYHAVGVKTEPKVIK